MSQPLLTHKPVVAESDQITHINDTRMGGLNILYKVSKSIFFLCIKIIITQSIKRVIDNKNVNYIVPPYLLKIKLIFLGFIKKSLSLCCKINCFFLNELI